MLDKKMMMNKKGLSTTEMLGGIILLLVLLGVVSYIFIYKPMQQGGAYSNVGELSKKTGQDSDGDGVIDMLDKCPDVGVKNNIDTIGKSMGCPIKAELTTSVGKSYYAYGGWLLYEGAGGMTEVCRAKDGITQIPESTTVAQLQKNAAFCVGAATT